jgi:hypothetical protein
MTRFTPRRITQVGLLVAAAITSLTWGGYRWWLRTAPPMPDTVEQAIETFKGERFARLPETRQEAYYDRSRQLFEQLDGERRRELRARYEHDPAAREAVSSAMFTMITREARKLTAMEPNQRQVVLDGIIAMQELGARRQKQRQAERRSQGQTNDNDPDRQRRRDERMNDARHRIEDWVEQGNPQRQAYLSELFKALRERRMERGLSPEPDFTHR